MLTLSLWAQKENKFIRRGNEAYEANKFTEADLSYRKALNVNENSFESHFNLGNALYKKSQYKEAVVKFNQAALLAKEDGEKAMTHYNLANSLLKQDKYKEAIESYKNSLRLFPGDASAMYNMSYAAQKLKEQQEGDQNQDKENQDNDQDDQDESGKDNKEKKEGGDDKEGDDQKKSEGDENDDQNESNQSKDPSDEKGDQPSKSAQQQRGASITPEDARKLLEALQGEEKKVQAKVLERKSKGKKVKAEKEW